MNETNTNFADRLLTAIDRKGSPVCVGLDPAVEKLPAELAGIEPLQAVETFCRGVLEAVAPHVPAVKPQIAYFERLGPEGVALYQRMVDQAKRLGLVVIGDIKRGDIGSTAAAYADAHLTGPGAPDAVTVNGYFGSDGLTPFAQAGAETGAGLFVLVRTSNPSAGAVQDFADADGKPFYMHMAELLAAFGKDYLGRSGYSSVGAVVGATWPTEARKLREVMPEQIFLVPGYGAQGATAADCAASFDADGRGAIVNASRSVIYAHSRHTDLSWQQAVARAARDFAEDIASALNR